MRERGGGERNEVGDWGCRRVYRELEMYLLEEVVGKLDERR